MKTQTNHEFSDNRFDCVAVGILAFLVGMSFGSLAAILSGVL